MVTVALPEEVFLDSRLPKLIFVLLVLYAAVHFASVYSQLPGVVASHFAARGVPNGWQAKQAFFQVLIIVAVVVVVIGFAIPKLISVLPVQLIHLPNKNYWLAPEHVAPDHGLPERPHWMVRVCSPSLQHPRVRLCHADQPASPKSTKPGPLLVHPLWLPCVHVRMDHPNPGQIPPPARDTRRQLTEIAGQHNFGS
jgi:Protein of unknown function (DUF1648)